MPMPHASLMPPQYIPTSWGNVFQETAELPLDVTARPMDLTESQDGQLPCHAFFIVQAS